jgi:hypothetical protein
MLELRIKNMKSFIKDVVTSSRSKLYMRYTSNKATQQLISNL